VEKRGIRRRQFLKAAAAFGGLLAARPLASIASSPLGGLGATTGAARSSKLVGSEDVFLVHTDLHNHSLISGDAEGDPHRALADMRAAGIDVACLTEHAIMGKGHGELTCPGWHKGGCDMVEGINDTDWAAMGEIADAAYAPGAFVSFRAFEWSTPTVGHLNVWFTEEFTDALHMRALVTPRAISQVDQVFPQSQPVVDLFEQAPDIATIKPFYKWLASAPGTGLFGGGNDGIACFNHPGDFGDFEAWTFDARAARFVTMFEAFNTNGYRYPDFFFYKAEEGLANPFNACLNAGWRVGFTGVSDEHSGVYGQPGMARGGLWVTELTRSAVRDALSSRRGFASLEAGLRLDATANGAPMGSAIAHDSGPLAIALDVDRGPDWVGKTLWVEVVRPGTTDPTLAASISFEVPAPDQPPVVFTVDADRGEGDWLFLRIIDPDRLPHPHAKAPFEAHGGAVAYASPWFLNPA
jgi:hypothetical protein